MFSPLNLAAGIEPSADPVLLARPAAYGVASAQRNTINPDDVQVAAPPRAASLRSTAAHKPGRPS